MRDGRSSCHAFVLIFMRDGRSSCHAFVFIFMRDGPILSSQKNESHRWENLENERKEKQIVLSK